jgi:hypothetical protein
VLTASKSVPRKIAPKLPGTGEQPREAAAKSKIAVTAPGIVKRTIDVS